MAPKKAKTNAKNLKAVQDPAAAARQARLNQYGISNTLVKGVAGKYKMSKAQQQHWLDNSTDWPSLQQGKGTRGRQYLPLKVLGGGRYGTVGLWRLEPRNEDEEAQEADDEDSEMPAHIVIKQAVGGNDGEAARLQMQWESKILRQIMGTETEHVVKVYKGFHLDGGSGASIERDPVPFTDTKTYDADLQISRIYLEYCENGDLSSYAKWRKTKRFILPEEHVWRIILCIFNGLLVLERGTEDLENEDQAWQAIAHFDIKPENILIGGCDDDEHERFQTLKLADFGTAMRIPETVKEVASKEWMNEALWRKTDYYAPPEQLFNNHSGSSQINTKTGVWSAGATIYELCCGQTMNQEDSYIYEHDDGKMVLISGNPKTLLDPARFPYSKILMRLIQACLAYHPSQRIDITTVVQRARTAVAKFDEINRDISDDTLYDTKQINVLVPGSEANVLTPNLTLLAVKNTKRKEKYEYGNEPQASPGAPDSPLFFSGTEVLEDLALETLQNYSYTALYKVPDPLPAVQSAKAKKKPPGKAVGSGAPKAKTAKPKPKIPQKVPVPAATGMRTRSQTKKAAP